MHETVVRRKRAIQIATGLKTAWSRILKRARITGFRWHDLRHHFDSRPVQRGVPVNTVRDLLGHSSIAMTLRYAHLAPDQRREAVAKLNELIVERPFGWDSVSDLITGRRGTRTLDPDIMSLLVDSR